MKPLLVHAHIFYKELASQICTKLQNLADFDSEIFITIVEDDQELKSIIKNILPKANIKIVENRGYDIRPFVELIQGTSLANYSYVVKIHSKRETKKSFLNGFWFKKSKWRDCAMSFIESKEVFATAIKALESNPKLAMIGNYRLVLRKKGSDKNAEKRLSNFLIENKLPIIPYSFVAGTMFVAKAQVFDKLNLVDLNQFEKSINHNSQYAHAIERFLGYLVYSKQMIIDDAIISKHEKARLNCLRAFNTFTRFLYYKKTTNSGKMQIKICKIPIISKKGLT